MEGAWQDDDVLLTSLWRGAPGSISMCWGGGRALGLWRGFVVSSKAEQKLWTQQAAQGGRGGKGQLDNGGVQEWEVEVSQERGYRFLTSGDALGPSPADPCPACACSVGACSLQPLQKPSRTCVTAAPCLGLTKSPRF